MLEGHVKVEAYASSWPTAEAIFDCHPKVESLWCDVFPGHGLDKFLQAGYTLVSMEPGPLGEHCVMLTRSKYKHLKEKGNG